MVIVLIHKLTRKKFWTGIILLKLFLFMLHLQIVVKTFTLTAGFLWTSGLNHFVSFDFRHEGRNIRLHFPCTLIISKFFPFYKIFTLITSIPVKNTGLKVVQDDGSKHLNPKKMKNKETKVYCQTDTMAQPYSAMRC